MRSRPVRAEAVPGGGPDSRTRLQDVARAAAVTKSTASRILNGDPTLSVREETRRRVLAVAKALDYRPHSTARALAGAQTRALAFLVPPLTNPMYVRVVRGAYEEAQKHDFVVLVAEDFDGQTADTAYTRLVASGRVDGLLIASARPRHPLLAVLTDNPVPHVFVNRKVPGSSRNVWMNDGLASAIAVAHLTALGHRHLGHVAGPASIEPGKRRADAFRTAARAARVEHLAVCGGPFNEGGGHQAMRRMLADHPSVTGVFVSSLSQTVGVLRALHQAGRRIPQDVSVISYDDLPLAEYLEPPVTSIRMPVEMLGSVAVGELLRQIAGEPPRDMPVPTEPELVLRSSTGPPGQRTSYQAS